MSGRCWFDSHARFYSPFCSKGVVCGHYVGTLWRLFDSPLCSKVVVCGHYIPTLWRFFDSPLCSKGVVCGHYVGTLWRFFDSPLCSKVVVCGHNVATFWRLFRRRGRCQMNVLFNGSRQRGFNARSRQGFGSNSDESDTCARCQRLLHSRVHSTF